MTAESWHKCRWAAFAVLCAALAPALANAQANPLARRGFGVPFMLDGRWNGADLERRSNCAASQNNGDRGTYAEYVVSVDLINHNLGVTQNGITGLTCTYLGGYREDIGIEWSGSYSCSDGKRGTFQSQGFLVTPNEMSIRLAIKLNTTETCDIQAVLGGSRL